MLQVGQFRITNLGTAGGDVILNSGGNAGISQRKGHCSMVTLGRKGRSKYRWICCFDCRKVNNSILIAIVFKAELRVNGYIELCVRSDQNNKKVLLQPLPNVYTLFPIKNASHAVYQNLISKLSSYLILSTFWQTIQKVQSQELLITFLLLRFNKHQTGWRCALERDGWSLMDVYTYTNNSILTVQNGKLFQGFVHLYKSTAFVCCELIALANMQPRRFLNGR